MASNLSGQVVSGPLNFDTPADYLQLHYDLDADKLDSTLVKLSQTVAKNAKVTNGLKDEIGALRAHIDNSVAKLQRSISVLDDGSRALKEQLHRVYDEVKAVQGSAIKRQEYDVDKDLMWREHHAAKRFIEDYEASKGHIERVQVWVREFLPTWYAGVSKAAADALERRLQSTTDETREAVARDVQSSTAAIVENTKNLAVMLDSRCGGLEAKQIAFGARVDDIDTRVGRQQRLLTSVTGSVDEIKEAVIDSNGSMDELRAAAAADLEGALALLGFGMADVRRLVDISIVGADRPPTAGSPSPRDRALTPSRGGGQLPPRPSSSGLAASTPTRPLLLPEAHAEVSMNTSGGADRRAQGRRLSSSVDLSMQGVRGTSPQAGSPRGPRTVAVSVRDEEAASDFLATLPAFRAVAASVRSAHDAAAEAVNAANARADALSAQVQRELADKVGLSKLKELMDKNKDERLQRNVEAMQKDITNLRESKVDAVRFNAVLETKADRDLVDSKADRVYVDSTVSHLAAQADAVSASIGQLKAVTEDMSRRLREGGMNISSPATVAANASGPNFSSAPATGQPLHTRNPRAGTGAGAGAVAGNDAAPAGMSPRQGHQQQPHQQPPALQAAPGTTPTKPSSRKQSGSGALGPAYDATQGSHVPMPSQTTTPTTTNRGQYQPPSTAPSGVSRGDRRDRAAYGTPQGSNATGGDQFDAANSARAGSSGGSHFMAAGGDDQPVLALRRRGGGAGRGGRGRGRAGRGAAAAQAEYDSPPDDSGEEPSPRGLPNGLGDVLHRMSAEEYQFERRNDARLLPGSAASRPGTSGYPGAPPEDL